MEIIKDNFSITNVDVYGLEQSIIRSRYPMTPDTTNFRLDENAFNRAKNLGGCKPGSGHDCFMKGIIVQFDLKAPQKMWKQIQRYKWMDIISSQSTMHCALKMDLTKHLPQWYVNSPMSSSLFHLQTQAKESGSVEDWNKFIDSLPACFSTTAGLSTNYLQLKTVYNQRKNHKLNEWQWFCEWIESLPNFMDFVGGSK